MKTAMMELRDKLLEVYQKEKESSFNSDFLKGYRDCLKNIANDIDAQMLETEKQQIICAHSYGIRFMTGNTVVPQLPISEVFYDRWIEGLEPARITQKEQSIIANVSNSYCGLPEELEDRDCTKLKDCTGCEFYRPQYDC